MFFPLPQLLPNAQTNFIFFLCLKNKQKPQTELKAKNKTETAMCGSF